MDECQAGIESRVNEPLYHHTSTEQCFTIMLYQTCVFFLSIATKSSVLPGMDAYERGRLMRQELMDTLEELSAELPPNTLDELIDELGGPDNVAEVRW